MDKNLGNKIAYLRKINNLSQKELATKLCVSNKTISKWECGNGCPDIETTKQIATLFNISIDELLSGNSLSKNIQDKSNNQKKLSKKLISILSIIFSSILISVISLICFFNIPREPEIIDSGLLEINEQESLLTKTVSNSIDTLSLIDSLELPRTNTWKLFGEINCSKEITSKTISLEPGDNHFYILVINNAKDQKLYSVIIRRKPLYTITFDCGEHYSNEDRFFTCIIEEGFTLPIPIVTPNKAGYYFDKWEFDFNTEIYSETTINAKYLPNSNTIIFNGNTSTNGQMPNIKVNTDSSITLPKNLFTKEHYSFVGWALMPNSSIVYEDEDIFYMNHLRETTLYAIWKPITYTINYELNGGTLETEIYSYTIEDNVELPIPQLNGATFNNWSFQNNSETGFTSLQTGTYGNITLYANWNYIEYTINYIMNNGVNNPLNPTKYTILDDNIILLEPTKTGYIFEGWSTGYNYYSKNLSINTKICRNQTIYTRWTPITYTIEYELNGGSLETTKNNFTIESNFALDNPELTGATFDGWYENPNFEGNSINQILPGRTTGIKLYAKWDYINYTIEYNNLFDGTNDTNNPDTFNILDKDIQLQNPTRKGYDFDGWSLESNYKTPITLIQTSSATNQVLYAKWNIINYQINYELNGGNCSSLRTTYNINSSFSLATPTLEGATFVGWYDNMDFTGNIITSITPGTVGTLSFYAKWDYTVYTILYNLNGADSNPNSKTTFTILDESYNLNEPTKAGFEFLGWYEDEKCTDYKITEINTLGYKNYSLYAKWVNSDYIKISTFNDLKNIDNQDEQNTYILINDIEITDTTWTGIKTLNSTLDGNGYYITTPIIGIIQKTTTTGKIKNLKISLKDNLTVNFYQKNNSTFYSGGMVSENNGVISNCVVEGNVTTIAPRTGLVSTSGWYYGLSLFTISNTGTIENCYVSGSYSADYSEAYNSVVPYGFVNTNTGSITNCYTNINFNLNRETYAFGGSPQEGEINYCFTMGDMIANVSGTVNFGSFGKYYEEEYYTTCFVSDSMQIKNNYRYVDQYGQTKYGYTTNKSSGMQEENISTLLSSGSIYTSYNFDREIWSVNNGILTLKNIW